MITNQTAFNKVYRHFVLQKGAPSFREDSTSDTGVRCLYRGDQGQRCAAGLLIPNRLYNPDIDMESQCISDVMEAYPEVCEYLGAETSEFLMGLQRAHDESVLDSRHRNLGSFRKNIKRRLLSFAENRGLKVPKN